MVMVEAYKVLRDRAPYPADQVVKQLHGNFAFILFYSKDMTLFLSRDGEGRVQLHWGTASDGSLVCTDDPNVISAACGNCYTLFPPGCIYINKSGLMSFDHPLHKVVGIPQVDNHGNINAVIFQVDLFTRIHSIPAPAAQRIGLFPESLKASNHGPFSQCTRLCGWGHRVIGVFRFLGRIFRFSSTCI